MEHRILDPLTYARLNPLRSRSEELDCDLDETPKGFCVQGYDSDSLVIDFPVEEITTRNDCFDYVQQLCKIWHARYTQQRACGCMTIMGGDKLEQMERIITIGIPHPKRYIAREVPWIVIPVVACTELSQITDQEEIQNTMVCIYGIDVTCDTMKKGGENKESGEEEEEEEEEEVEE